MYLFDEIWFKVLELVKETHPVIHDTWFSMITDTDFDENSVTLTVPSSFVRDMITEYFSDIISTALTKILRYTPDIRFVTEQEKKENNMSVEYMERFSLRTAMENEGLSYMQLGERRLENNDKTGALKALCHAYKCLCRVQYNPNEFHFQTINSLEQTIDALSREIQLNDNAVEEKPDTT